MPISALQPLSGTDVAAFTLGVIALMLFTIWARDREPGMLWMAAGFGMEVLLAAFNDTMVPQGAVPHPAYLLVTLAMHGCYAAGLAQYLGLPERSRARLVALLTLPLLVPVLALFAGMPLERPAAVVPIVFNEIGLAAMCAYAAMREPGAGHGLLALGALLPPLCVAYARMRGFDPYLARYYAWPAAINFGIVLLVGSLMRRRRAMRSSEASALRMTSFYAALTKTNHAMMRSTDVQHLYGEICRIAVETGHAVLAYVGVPEDGRLRPVATAGPTALLEGLRIDLDPASPYAQGPASLAMREGTPQVRNDMMADPRIAPWHERARRVGVSSQASFPFRRSGRVAGVLTLYMGQAGAFDEAVVQLLSEMAQDLSFALDSIDREAARLQALQLAEAGLQRFARLFHSAPVSAVLLSTPEGRIIDANDAFCARYGVTREQAVGRTGRELDIGPVQGEREAFHEQVMREHRVRNFVGRVRLRSGQMRELLLNGELVEYQDQTCILAMGLDISELRQAEKAREAQAIAESANRAKTEFLSRMSHELRTPLNAVLGFSQLLQSEAEERLQPREIAQLQHIEQAGWHLLTLINDVLDVSRIEAGNFQVDAHGLPLTPLLDEALQMSVPLARQRGVVLEPDYRGGALLGVVADPVRLRQVMLNLLSNAIKYNRPGGSVRVAATREGEWVQIDVVDTGLGMTREQLEHLYEPFNRLGRERGGIEGTGIGLTLTRQLVRLMHGEMEVKSESGAGTCVRISLPHLPLPASAPQASGAAPCQSATGPQGVVLYIEDNPVNALLVERMLARWGGVHFVHAEDGSRGLELARRLMPQLVLLDMHLPDMDGSAVLSELRADQATHELRIIALSADAMPEEIERARRLGVNDYWTKPLNFERFMADVSRLLRSEAAC